MRITRTSQPQTPVGIDWGNLITRGLAVSLPLSSNAGLRSLGTNKIIGTPLNAGYSVAKTGSQLKLSGAGYVTLGSACLLPSDITPFTLALYELPASVAAYGSLLSLSGGSTQWLWIRGSAVGYKCALGKSSGAVQEFHSVGAPVVGVGRRFLITSPGGINAYTGYRLWMDGVEQSSSGSSFGTIASTTNYIGWDSGGEAKWDGGLQDYNLWDRVLSDAEIRAYFDNPYQIFKPINRPIFVGLSAELPAGDPSATADQIILPLGQSATATVTAQATASQTLADVTQSATAVAVSSSANAAATQQIDLVTQSATAVSISSATASQQLPDLGQSATSTAIASATASQQLDLITQSATAQAPIPGVATATASQQLPDFTQAATSTVTASASASQQLDAFVSVQTCVAIATAQASSQIAAFTQSATVVTVVGGAVYPLASQVLLGVMYGPTGIEYTGTLTGGTGPTAADIAAAVWAYTQ